jgi:hypothetical protein
MPDVLDAQVVVNGRVWKFEYDRFLGPLWLKKSGEPRACQYPTNKAVWAAFAEWLEKWEAARTKQQP